MKISDNKTLRELQDEFQKEFPFLKIEFYNQPHFKGGGSARSQLLNPEVPVGEVRKIHVSGYIKTDCNLTVEAFEQTLQRIFGLNIQVFRKSFGHWVQTWSSDAWPLKEQNLRGMLTQGKIISTQ